jgi:hypothetical protein
MINTQEPSGKPGQAPRPQTQPQVISEVLGLKPTQVIAKGSVSGSGHVREHHTWSLGVDNLDNTEVDLTGHDVAA